MMPKYKWLIDTQLPPKLVKLFSEFEQEAIHTRSYKDGIYLDDSEIRKIAIRENRIIITKDSDFFNGHFGNVIMPQILYLKTGNLSNKELFDIVRKSLPLIINAYSVQNAKLIVIDNVNIYFY